jgi:phage protein D
MGLSAVGIVPEFVIKANGSDITDKINRRLISLRYSDSAGFDSDSLEFTISNGVDGSPVQMPDTGAQLELSLGYDARVVKMGKFIVDEVTCEGWPETITVRARSATFDKKNGDGKQLQTQKNKKWAKGTFSKMVQTIAKENGLTGSVSQSLSSIDVPATHQIDESDLHFLIRVGRRYDAVIKVADGRLMAVKKSENKTMSGNSLSLSLSPKDKITSYRFTRAKREESGSVRAYWHEHKKAKRHAVTVGSGDPETSLKGVYTDKDAAEAAAKSELARRGRQKETLSLTLPGRPEIVAEASLAVSGFWSGIDGSWNITSVEHEIGSNGYVCTLEAERTNADAYANGATATDKIEGEDDHADEANDDGSQSQ